LWTRRHEADSPRPWSVEDKVIATNGHIIACGVVNSGAFNLSQETGELKIIGAGSGN